MYAKIGVEGGDEKWLRRSKDGERLTWPGSTKTDP
jgi:hypothetical protein